MPAADPRSRTLLRVLFAGAVLLAACDRASPPAIEVSVAPPASAAPPVVIAFDPPNGATDVDPSRTMLSVTFDRDMDPQGWAWVIEGPDTSPDLGEASFDASARTNTVAARLEPGRTYVLWINSERFSHFRGRDGTPATPVRWTFSTRGTPRAAAPHAPVLLSAHAARPRVVQLEPPNDARDVDPATTVLRATFDRPMEGSWSWVTEGGETFPETTGKAWFEPDGRTAALPVRLEPGRSYVVWLNSESYQLFRDLQGTPAEPLRWTFRTAPR